jgi:hypothetical protein
MSILLSAYYPEGLVYVADKNITETVDAPIGSKKFVDPTGTKVLSWPNRKAIIGSVGVAELAEYSMEEYLRIFIAGTRDFTDIEQLANQFKDQVQVDFSNEFSTQEVFDKQCIFHLGGFTKKDGASVPVLYHIWNYRGKADAEGVYPPGERIFNISEDIKIAFQNLGYTADYPHKTRDGLQKMIDQNQYLWFNNGLNLGAFNLFKDVLWQTLHILEKTPFALDTPGINGRVAFCRMAVELFGSYYTYHKFPDERAVGGGSDAVYIPWP